MDMAGWANISANQALNESLFNVAKKQSITDIGNEVLTQSVSNTSEVTEKSAVKAIEDLYSPKIVDKEDALAISNFASNLSSLDKKLSDAKNTEGVDGLRHIAMHFAKNTSGFADFMTAVDKLDDKSLQQFFSTANKIGDKGLDVGEFVDSVSSLSSKDKINDTVNSVNKLIDKATDATAMIKDYDKLMDSLKKSAQTPTASTNTQSYAGDAAVKQWLEGLLTSL